MWMWCWCWDWPWQDDIGGKSGLHVAATDAFGEVNVNAGVDNDPARNAFDVDNNAKIVLPKMFRDEGDQLFDSSNVACWFLGFWCSRLTLSDDLSSSVLSGALLLLFSILSWWRILVGEICLAVVVQSTLLPKEVHCNICCWWCYHEAAKELCELCRWQLSCRWWHDIFAATRPVTSNWHSTMTFTQSAWITEQPWKPVALRGKTAKVAVILPFLS